MLQRIIIGTRGSRLALAQANETQARLHQWYPELEVDLKIFKTEGDRRLDLALDASGNKGLFTTELEQALIDGSIDIAVHSLKDLPIVSAPKTYVSAVLPREIPYDVLLSPHGTLDKLPRNAIIGTSSPRRIAQLRLLCPSCEIRPIRGNVETRIRKMEEGEFDAIVMAAAGLHRLGLQERISHIFYPDEIVSAPGQAAIALQQREDDETIRQIILPLNCPATLFAVEIERELLHRLGGGCALPMGCLCTALGEERYMLKVYYNNKGKDIKLTREFTLKDRELALEELTLQLSYPA